MNFSTLWSPKNSLGGKYTAPNDDTNMRMKPVTDYVLDAFIRGLPEKLSIFEDTSNPKDINEAYEHARHVEESQKYKEKDRTSVDLIGKAGASQDSPLRGQSKRVLRTEYEKEDSPVSEPYKPTLFSKSILFT